METLSKFVETHSILITLIISIFTLLGLIYTLVLQRIQTKYLIKNIQYSSYLRQVDELNIVNNLLIDKNHLKETFNKFNDYSDISTTDLGFAWLVINRYESAFKAKELGLITNQEWEVAKSRIKIDLNHEIINKVWKRDYFGFDYDSKFRDYINKEILKK